MLTSLEFFCFFVLANAGSTVLYFWMSPDLNYTLYILAVVVIALFAGLRLVEHLISLPTDLVDLVDLLPQEQQNRTDTRRTDTRRTDIRHTQIQPKDLRTFFGLRKQFTVIIPAYLPAEQNIIIETIKHFLALKLPLDLILAYNTPQALPIEKQLKRLPIRVFKVPNSKSKAENINYVLHRIRTPYVAIFDADHLPLKENFTKALSWLQNGFDIVQGSCLPLPNSCLGKFLSVEFNQMYNINHLSRPRLWDFAIFGGSNGYFKTEVLQQLGFDSTMLTEDIDLSLRALLSNLKIQFDRTIISYEQAPKNLQELWKQRVRWSQGWLQVCCKYTQKILSASSQQFSSRQKFGLLLLLPFREWGQFVCLQTLPLAIALSVQLHNWKWASSWLIIFAILVSLLLLEPLWIALVRDSKSANCTWFMTYALLSPFYLIFLKVVTLYGYFREIRGNHHFEVTGKANRIAKPGDLVDRSGSLGIMDWLRRRAIFPSLT